MDLAMRAALDNLHAPDRAVQNQAFGAVLAATDKPVDWAYEVWDTLLITLRHTDNHLRAIAAQILCNLAKSDPQQRMLTDLDALLIVTRDERFVTARHCLQSLWKVGIVGKAQQQKVIEGLADRFNQCSTEKNCTLIRYDIIQNLKQIYDVVQDDAIRAHALALIATETDLKYQKKYATLWRAKQKPAT